MVTDILQLCISFDSNTIKTTKNKPHEQILLVLYNIQVSGLPFLKPLVQHKRAGFILCSPKCFFYHVLSETVERIQIAQI